MDEAAILSQLDIALSDKVKELNNMHKLSTLGQRIKDTQAKMAAEADKINARLDALDEQAPGAFAKARAVVDQHHSEVAALETEISQLSNLPPVE